MSATNLLRWTVPCPVCKAVGDCLPLVNGRALRVGHARRYMLQREVDQQPKPEKK